MAQHGKMWSECGVDLVWNRLHGRSVGLKVCQNVLRRGHNMALKQLEVSFEDQRASVSLPCHLSTLPTSRILTEPQLLVQQPCCPARAHKPLQDEKKT